ncbi:hypothetical protein H920_16670 [Fukomys damarensis]|uniref:Uncharacterized protein n=1 Tax=Fukomys damarensis TaxID=885580 RepID=A0A091CU11_FUKDA|nr:hypothetical protein H920_16670 [Fukomys damarensis]
MLDPQPGKARVARELMPLPVPSERELVTTSPSFTHYEVTMMALTIVPPKGSKHSLVFAKNLLKNNGLTGYVSKGTKDMHVRTFVLKVWPVCKSFMEKRRPERSLKEE